MASLKEMSRMKISGKCVKCDSVELVRTPDFVRFARHANHIPLSFTNVVVFTRWMCSNCGYIESWIESPADLLKLREIYRNSKRA
jgi:predicted nucleic-acid-binding Zn-ribbon protein